MKDATRPVGRRRRFEGWEGWDFRRPPPGLPRPEDVAAGWPYRTEIKEVSRTRPRRRAPPNGEGKVPDAVGRGADTNRRLRILCFQRAVSNENRFRSGWWETAELQHSGSICRRAGDGGDIRGAQPTTNQWPGSPSKDTSGGSSCLMGNMVTAFVLRSAGCRC